MHDNRWRIVVVVIMMMRSRHCNSRNGSCCSSHPSVDLAPMCVLCHVMLLVGSMLKRKIVKLVSILHIYLMSGFEKSHILIFESD